MTLKQLALYSALVLPALCTTQAYAQDGGLDEIIVTAQKRSENLQDVPISISTLSEESLNNILQGGEDIRALATRVPGLYAESSNGRIAPRFYIRGLGNTDFDLAASQPVSIIFDEVVQENVVLKSFPIFDVERVEVLRGPQGTLFGRNTPAGIVKFDTVKPSQDTNGYGAFSIGTFGTLKAEGAVGGALSDNLSARASVLYSSRKDWISNIAAGEDDAFGGFDEIAGRLQVLFSPSDNVDLLLNVHGRDLDGTASVFRANIFSPGDNELNNNFIRTGVFYDGGDNNPQEYESYGGSARLTWGLDGMTFTSITAYETAEGTSRGDIDGGFGAVFLPGGSFPGFIPFPSDTLDGIDDLDQFTQEFRRASDTDEAFNWQVGFYYFDSDLSITTNPFFVAATTVRHQNDSWSIFGQGSYQLTEDLKFTGGLRYTDDNKEFEAVAANFPVAPVEVSDGQLSWDASLTYNMSDQTNVYARVARGFRAPTIQGRDVAFFGNPSTADSETILSYEVGFKSEFWDNRARLNGALFYYDANDLQFSAIGGAGNFNQLVNADGRGLGFEADFELAPTDNFLLTAGLSYNDTEITQDGLQVAACGGGCTVTDPIDANGLATIEGNPFPQAPDWIFNFTARYGIPFAGGEFYALTDWAFQGDTNFFLYESAEFNSSGNFEGGLRVGYAFGDGAYDVSVFARNITDEENAKGGIDFNNLTGFVNEPRIIGVAARANF